MNTLRSPSHKGGIGVLLDFLKIPMPVTKSQEWLYIQILNRYYILCEGPNWKYILQRRNHFGFILFFSILPQKNHLGVIQNKSYFYNTNKDNLFYMQVAE